jgi:hypothetical protein
MKKTPVTAFGGETPTNGAHYSVSLATPFTVEVEVTGKRPLLFHRWNCEAVEAKAKAAKNSLAKKTDDVETYIYRNERGELCLPDLAAL